MKKTIIIPARYNSSRFKGKPLALISGKPMIQVVYEKACSCGLDAVIVATDDKRIYDTVKAFGGSVYMTSAHHPTGTDRLAEIATKLKFNDDDIIINLQGDEPLVAVDNVHQVVANIEKMGEIAMATLCEPMVDLDEIANPNHVKVVFDEQQRALYFSRSPIPCLNTNASKTAAATHYYRHIGLYAYRSFFVKKYPTLSKSMLEEAEQLEQLRALCHGYAIHVDVAMSRNGPGVDTPEALAKVIQLMKEY